MSLLNFKDQSSLTRRLALMYTAKKLGDVMLVTFQRGGELLHSTGESLLGSTSPAHPQLQVSTLLSQLLALGHRHLILPLQCLNTNCLVLESGLILPEGPLHVSAKGVWVRGKNDGSSHYEVDY